jgi:hypothetical protein
MEGVSMAFDVLPPGIQNFLLWEARLYAGEKETLAISPGPPRGW